MKWNETWLLCFYTHSCESFKIVQIKIQKGQSVRNEMKPDYYAWLYSFMWNSYQSFKKVQIKIQKGQSIRNERKLIIILVKASK